MAGNQWVFDLETNIFFQCGNDCQTKTPEEIQKHEF